MIAMPRLASVLRCCRMGECATLRSYLAAESVTSHRRRIAREQAKLDADERLIARLEISGGMRRERIERALVELEDSPPVPGEEYACAAALGRLHAMLDDCDRLEGPDDERATEV